jgi:prepilin-type N-terminal cleavage/methylation domain-containing protein
MIESKNQTPNAANDSEKGFSVVEMLIVLAVVAILSTFAVMSFGNQTIHEADAQTSTIIDFLQEARQRALSQRTIIRVEINNTLRDIRLVNESTPLNAADDVLIKSAALTSANVFIGTRPTNVTTNPAELTPVPVAAFAASNHPVSLGNSVIVIRFQGNGVVLNAGTNGGGANAVPTGSTIYVWSKRPNDPSPSPTNALVMRAVTVQASTGATKFWQCLMTNDSCSTWTRN